jgi:hypothetical protein
MDEVEIAEFVLDPESLLRPEVEDLEPFPATVLEEVGRA